MQRISISPIVYDLTLQNEILAKAYIPQRENQSCSTKVWTRFPTRVRVSAEKTWTWTRISKFYLQVLCQVKFSVCAAGKCPLIATISISEMKCGSLNPKAVAEVLIL